MGPLPVDVERRHIEIKAGQFVAQRCTLRRHTEPLEFLCKGLQLFAGLVRDATLVEEGTVSQDTVDSEKVRAVLRRSLSSYQPRSVSDLFE